MAAEEGPGRFSWWPDWRGEVAAIVACGPSVKGENLLLLKDRVHVVAIKESIEVCPWAEVVYGCDAAWWLHRNGLPKFGGIKIAHGQQATSQHKDIRRAEIKINSDALLLEQPMVISNGGNSGHQALNLVAQFGATDIILVGFDMSADPNHLHWYGRNKWNNANNPMGSNFQRWLKGFEIIKKDIDRAGITVINVSQTSTMKSFRKARLPEIMEEWGL